MTSGSDRLERSRLAILEHVHRKDQRRHGREPQVNPQLTEEQVEAMQRARRRPGAAGWMDTARDTIGGWWRYHPANTVLEITKPMLSSYARRKPVQYLGIAAVAGAALFFMRPWKLISVTGILVALVKSPQVAALVMQAMSSSQNPRDDEPVHD